MESVVDRFLRYIKIDTQSDFRSESYPSTACQKEFQSLLKKELEEIGLSDITMDEYGYVMATIPSTTSKNVPVIGFIAHVDTSPDFNGKGVSPQIVKNYDAGDIVLNKEQNIVMSPKDFPELKSYISHDLITTDGTTLLGADDKAGVAEIMYAAQYLINNPQIEHGKIRIGFTMDEEIGNGVDYFDVKAFGADYAYTLDGGGLGELEYENFNAASANIIIQGRSVHPGYSKNKMLNALNIAHKIHSMLPCEQRPEYTENREGFYHLTSINGSVDSASMNYIIREHSTDIFNKRKQTISDIVDFVNSQYSYKVVSLEIKDQYFNMGDVIKNHFEVVEIAKKSMENLSIKPIIRPVRGGTDGARLSFMSLPCPNIFAGGVNYHGRFEFVSTSVMQKASDVIVEIARQWAANK